MVEFNRREGRSAICTVKAFEALTNASSIVTNTTVGAVDVTYVALAAVTTPPFGRHVEAVSLVLQARQTREDML